MPFNTAPCCTCDGLTIGPPNDDPCAGYIQNINACCRISGQPVTECSDLSCLIIFAQLDFGTVPPGPECTLVPWDGCLTSSGGLTFTGTGNGGDVSWNIVLEKVGECTSSANAYYRIVSGTATGLGITVTFTLNEETELLEIETTGTSVCEVVCQSVGFTGTWVPRLWTEDTRPDTIHVSVSPSEFPDNVIPSGCFCDEYVIEFDVPFYASGAILCNGMSETWEYRYIASELCEFDMTIRLVTGGSCLTTITVDGGTVLGIGTDLQICGRCGETIEYDQSSRSPLGNNCFPSFHDLSMSMTVPA